MAKISGRWATAASVLSIGALLGVATTLPASAAPIPVPSVSAFAEDEATTPTVDPSTTPTDQTQPSEGSETETDTSTPSPEVSTTPTTPAAPEEPAQPSNVAVPTEDEAATEDEGEGEGEGEGTEPQREYEEGPWGEFEDGLQVVPNWFFTDANGNGLLDVGETYGVTFTITNVTDMDLKNLTINAIHPSYPWDTPGPSIAAGETVEMTQTNVLDQYYFDYTGSRDEAFNYIGEAWVIRGISPNDKGVVSPILAHRFPVPDLAPSLSTSATVTSTTAPTRAGDVITYSVAAKNTGNTTLAIPVLASPAQTTAGTGFRSFGPDVEKGILPQGTTTLTGSYVVTKTDVARGVVNISINATSQSQKEDWVLSPAQTLTVKLDPTTGGGLAETGSDLSSVVPGIAVLVLAAGVGLLGLQRRRSSVDAL
ncbi:DUF7507 domain-containing protein [Mycetocola lacteus]|nr:hypothetical protein [Mycetocola lacteus]